MAAFRAVRPAGGSPERFSIVRFAPVPSQRTGMAADGRNRPSWRRDGAQCAARGRAADSGGAGAASIRRNRARRAVAADACPPVEGFSGRSRGCGPFARAAQAASCLAGKYSGSDRGGAHVAGRAGARNGCGYPRGCGVGTSAGECLPHLRDSSASRRPDGGELPAPSSLRPRPHSALPAFSAQSFAAGRHTLRPDMRFAAARAEAAKRRRGRPEARGLSDESRPPPSSVPPAIREFSRRGGSRRVDKTCRTASARRPERSTPRGCSLRPRPARRPEALRAIWLRRRTPPRLRADRA